jgi:DNA-binding LytR/AlgR family response regulator
VKVSIRKIADKNDEQVVVECVEVTRNIEEIVTYVETKGTVLSGAYNERTYSFNLEDVCYFEAIDERVFAYTDKRVYELKTRLYQLEKIYAGMFFIRCSKSILINMMKLDSISPALNGRFYAHIKNGEKLIISRQYATGVINMIKGGNDNEF